MTTANELADRLDLYATGDEHQRDVEDAAAMLRQQATEIERLKLPEHVVQHYSNEIAKLRAENQRLTSAITKLHSAKGRYHTQLACCDLFDAAGLKNERPTK